MKALLLIAKDNIKKKKSDAVIMLILIAIATMFMYVGISVLFNYKDEIDQRNDMNNGADYLYYTAGDYYQNAIDIIKSNSHVKEAEEGEFLHFLGTYRNKDEAEKDGHETYLMMLPENKEKNISKINIIDAGNEWKENSVILPYYMHVAEGYETGDDIFIKCDDNSLKLEVYGFSEDVLFSNPMNIEVIKLVVPQSIYESSCREFGNIYRGVSVKLDDYPTDKFEKDMLKEISSSIDNLGDTNVLSLNYDVMKRGTGITVSIFMALLTIFAVLLIVVVLIIIKFNIGNSIEENIKNTGIMQACGYTCRQMILATMLQFEIIGFIGIILGFAFAKAASNFVGNIISSSMGLYWDMGFSILSACITAMVIIIFIGVVAELSARRFKKINPIDALRNGIYSHNFKKNKLKLEGSPFSLNVSLGIKSTLFNIKKNFFICTIVVILTFVTNMSVACFNNFLDKDKLLQFVGTEYVDALLQYKGDEKINYNNLAAELESMEEVKKTNIVFENETTIVKGKNDSKLHITAFKDSSKLDVDMIVDGRNPQYDNEVVLTTHVCKKYGLVIGDTVKIKNGNKSFDYVLVGRSQGMNHMGETGMMSLEGSKHLFPDETGYGISIYFKDGVDSEATIDKYREIYGKDYNIIDYNKAMQNVIAPLKIALKAFCFALVCVSAIVIALILILLIKSHIIREKKQMGVYKAIGYTTPQLIIQIMVSYLPVVLIGGILGGIATRLLIRKMFILCFSTFSIEKITIDIPFISYLVCIGGIVIWSEIIALISASRIRKIMPYRMITEI